MFDNIGKKMQALATVICWIGIIASVICTFVLWGQHSDRNPTVVLGFGVLIGGCLASWLSSMLIYAFGQLVDDIHAMSMGNSHSPAQPLPSKVQPLPTKEDEHKGAYYKKGMQLFKDKKYTAAASAFKACGSYLDAAQQAKECYYQQGYEKMIEHDYSLAKFYFACIPGYKDADEKKAECERLAE